MSPRQNRKKTKAKAPILQPKLQPALPERSFAARRRDAVMSIVSARKDGDPASTLVAEQNFISELLGNNYIHDDEEAEVHVHSAYRTLSSVQRAEALASEIYDAFHGMRRYYSSDLTWEKSHVHPFTLDENSLRDMWELRNSVDRIGIAYYVYAKAAAFYWTFDKKAACFPSMQGLGSADILLTTFEMLSGTDESMWDKPMQQVLDGLLNDDFEEAA